MPAPSYSPQDRDTDPGWVRARTQADIDRELAAWADAPLWGGAQSESLEDGGPPTEPMPVADAMPSPAEVAPPVDYSWLYRDGTRRTEPPLNVLQAAPPSQTWVPVQSVQPAGPVTSPANVAPARRAVDTPNRVDGPNRVDAPNPVDAPNRRRHVVLASVLGMALCLALGGGVALVAFGVINTTGSGQPSSTFSSSPDGNGPVPGQVWDGALSPIGDVSAKAECVARSAQDGSGKKVSYAARNAVDGDADTAWRCDRSTDVAITFTVPKDQQIASVGLINGYAKVDPSDGSKRYREYRRILRATWTLPDGNTIEQRLDDGDQDMQNVRVPVSPGGTVTLTITKVTNPGSASATRDAVLISDIALSGPRV